MSTDYKAPRAGSEPTPTLHHQDTKTPNSGRSLCLVTGPTGAVGHSLVNALLRRGLAVRVLARHPIPAGFLSQPVETVIGDIADPTSVAVAMIGAATVFHLAAKLHVANPTAEMRAEYERVNVEGTRVVVEAARAAGVRRLVLFSTISVYGPTGPEPVNEDSPPNPESIYADTKLRAEKIALSAQNSYGEPLSAVLRMAAIYGPRMKGNYVTLANALARGRFLPVGSGDNLRTIVFDADAVEAAILASRAPIAAGRIYNVSDGSVHSLREIISAISGALGRRPPRAAVPLGVARLAALAADVAMVAAGRRRMWSASVEKLVESVAVSGDHIQQELGFRPEYDLVRGWNRTVETWRGEVNRSGHIR